MCRYVEEPELVFNILHTFEKDGKELKLCFLYFTRNCYLRKGFEHPIERSEGSIYTKTNDL
ncbi:hypothetical protein HOLleu_08446 [Holothuria leucospilota]|uniref:Uncharacterized protein n=1 Tax=Holothuria leucospilota TaxID=206669 RepID=A0A9Q1HGZ0_HOLLE|nr:hypothetical protein HOLleu_08446 [Holothuria leucospilota]